MARKMTILRVFELGQQFLAIPESAVLDTRRRQAQWTEGDLHLAVVFQNRDGDRLAWYLFVGDEKFDSAMSEFGNMAVRLESLNDDSIPWPAANEDQKVLEKFFGSGLVTARNFVSDREGLARIFASSTPVQRGRIEVWLTPSSYPARLVKALVIARDLGNSELEESILRKLRSGPLVQPDGEKVDIAEDARYWAKEYGKALGFTVSF